MRASANIVAAPGGPVFIEGCSTNAKRVAVANGYGSREKDLAGARKTLTADKSAMTASMLRDIEGVRASRRPHRRRPDRARRKAGIETPTLARVLTGLKAYENRKAREAA